MKCLAQHLPYKDEGLITTDFLLLLPFLTLVWKCPALGLIMCIEREWQNVRVGRSLRYLVQSNSVHEKVKGKKSCLGLHRTDLKFLSGLVLSPHLHVHMYFGYCT